MSAKLDKETLLKNRFWIGLGVFLPLWLLILLVLWAGVGGTVSAARKDFEGAVGKVKGVSSSSKNGSFTAPAKEKELTLNRQKGKVWKTAWEPQSELMTWPGDQVAPLHEKLKNAYFGDPIEYAWRQQYAASLYATQMSEFTNPFPPAYFNGSGWRQIIRPVATWKNPSTEELWLAQEDLWVKREMMQVVRSALDSAGRCESTALLKRVEPVGKDEPLPEGIAARLRFRNPTYELELLVKGPPKTDETKPGEPMATPAPKPEEPKPDDAKSNEAKPDDAKPADQTPPPVLSGASKLKNVAADRQPRTLTGLVFRLTQRNAKGELQTAELPVEGGKLEADKTVEIKKEVVLKGFDPQAAAEKNPIEVELLTDKADPLPAGAKARHRLRNASWELELLLEPDAKDKNLVVVSGKSQLKNVHPHRRLLMRAGVLFRIDQRDKSGLYREPQFLLIEGEPLAWGKAEDLKKAQPLPGFAADDPIEVTQVFNWYTAPVKRVDRLEVGTKFAQSHRTANRPLQPAPVFAAKAGEGTSDTSAGAGTSPPGGMAGMGGMTAPVPPGTVGSGGEGGQTAASATATPNGLEKNRYVDISDQVRRLPVAMVLVVDQANIPDVLTAFSNSKLRLWVTQWHWQHVRGVQPPPKEAGSTDVVQQRPPGEESGEGTMSTAPPMGPMGPMGPGLVSGPRYPGAGGYRMGVPPGSNPFFPTGGDLGSMAKDQDDPNLVELVVYSIASLYERFPPKQPAGEAGAPSPKP